MLTCVRSEQWFRYVNVEGGVVSRRVLDAKNRGCVLATSNSFTQADCKTVAYQRVTSVRL